MGFSDGFFGAKNETDTLIDGLFLLQIADVFNMPKKNRVVVVGVVLSGKCKKGETATLRTRLGDIQIKILGIEKNRKQVNATEKGERVALLIAPAKRGDEITTDTVRANDTVIIKRY